MAPFTSPLLGRLRADFRLSIITLFGACAVLAVAPFAVLRFAQGQWVAGLVDSAVVLGITIPVLIAWRGGNIEAAGLFIAIITTLGELMIIAVVGLAGVFWLYPTLLGHFFLVRPWAAIGIAMAAILAIQFQPAVFASPTQRMTITATLLLLSIFAYIFARRTTVHRDALEQIATLDPLTGARNRRAMDDEVDIALNAHQRSSRPVALAVLDLDHFKAVNDRFGHEAGDRVLQAFVALVQRSTRATDRLFRYGGEEFVLLMEHTDEIGLDRAFRNLQRRVHESLRAADETPVTVSIGAAVLRHGETRDAWFARADAALYRAKQAGRDRWVVDGHEA